MDVTGQQEDSFVLGGVRFLIEGVVSFLSVIRNSLALWDDDDVHGLFGFELSDSESSVLVAAILLPMVGENSTTQLDEFQRQFALDEQRSSNQLRHDMERVSVDETDKSLELILEIKEL